MTVYLKALPIYVQKTKVTGEYMILIYMRWVATVDVNAVYGITNGSGNAAMVYSDILFFTTATFKIYRTKWDFL